MVKKSPGVRVLRVLNFGVRITFVAAGCATISALTIVPATWQLQAALRSAARHEGFTATAFHAVMSMAFQIAGAGIGFLGRYRSARHTEVEVLEVRRRLLESALSERIELTKGTDRADPQSTIVIDTERIDQFADQILGNLLPGILLAIIGTALVIGNSPVLGAIAFLAGFPIFWSIVLTTRKSRLSAMLYWEEHRFILKRVLRLLQARELISAHGAQASVVENEMPHQLAFTRQASALKRNVAVSSMTQTIGFGILAALLLVVSTIQLQNGAVAIDQLFASLFSLVMIQSGVRMTVTAQAAMAAGVPALERIEQQLNQLAETERQTALSLGVSNRLRIDRVQATDLGHGFPSADATESTLLFEHLYIHIQRGDRLLVQGPNGSGKTTLLLILAGQLRPLFGTLEINGSPAETFDATSVRRGIAYVAQNVVLVDGSIEDNLRLLGDTASSAELDALLHDVGIAFPLNHQIGDEGQRLSGGQRQRLAIARALLHQPDLLLLDEPANHLDTDLKSFLSSIEHRLQNTAVVIVSHGANLSSIGYRTLSL
jgi:ABC-type bacteriocin/lantibiotic exporter with double-glycine peptidase domain